MPAVTHARNAWLVQLCTLTAFLLCLGWVSTASAAAPMCGVHAQSVVAPPIGTPASSDALTAGCVGDDGAPLRAAGVPQRNAPEKLTFTDLPIRALPTLPQVAACPVTARRSPAAAEHELLATGFARSIDRPPKA